MTAVADQPVRAAVRDTGGGSRAATARPGPAPKTTPLTLPAGVQLDAGALHGWSWTPVRPAPPAHNPGWGWATERAGRRWSVSGAPSVRRPSRLPVVVGDKLREWGRRYLLAEIAGTLAALTAALAVHTLTGSLASAALAGSVAESIAYYGVVLRRMLPALYRRHAGAGRLPRLVRTARDVVTEVSDFLAAELADTLLVRPGLIYLAAGWAGSGVVWGLLIGKLLADVGFYAIVIPSYELRKKLMRR
ncbi:MAG TPA: hypothetical protein VLM05_12235 [Mycobacteriales bacterium]|nr:hypothetical protein [Mycobacteriales bacterium]